MKNVIIIIYLIHSINANLTTVNLCQNCSGKIHTKEDLELVKQPLIINKIRICHNEKYRFIIIVKSGDYQRRNFTRNTWATEIIKHFNVPVLYAVGYPKDPSMQKRIIAENEIHRDILEFNILESYYNLTLKTTSVLFWYKQYCANSSDYLLYVDDDVLIHVDKLLMYMYRINNNNTIEGWFEKSGKIQRKGIGGISHEDFPIDRTPDYLWGAAVVYPSNIISDVLIEAIFNTTLPIFFRDDVFINGFIAEQAGINRQHMKGILLYDQTEDDLKTNIIIIDFKNEKNREKAWNCYKYNIQCNKGLTIVLILKILGGISLLVLISVVCCKYLKTTELYYDVRFWYYRMNLLFTKNRNSWLIVNRKGRSTVGIQQAKFGIQWLINLRRMGVPIGFIFVIIVIILYYVVYNK